MGTSVSSQSETQQIHDDGTEEISKSDRLEQEGVTKRDANVVNEANITPSVSAEQANTSTEIAEAGPNCEQSEHAHATAAIEYILPSSAHQQEAISLAEPPNAEKVRQLTTEETGPVEQDPNNEEGHQQANSNLHDMGAVANPEEDSEIQRQGELAQLLEREQLKLRQTVRPNNEDEQDKISPNQDTGAEKQRHDELIELQEREQQELRRKRHQMSLNCEGLVHELFLSTFFDSVVQTQLEPLQEQLDALLVDQISREEDRFNEYRTDKVQRGEEMERGKECDRQEPTLQKSGDFLAAKQIDGEEETMQETEKCDKEMAENLEQEQEQEGTNNPVQETSDVLVEQNAKAGDEMREIEEPSDREVAENLEWEQEKERKKGLAQANTDALLAEQIAKAGDKMSNIEEQCDRELAESLEREQQEEEKKSLAQATSDALLAEQIAKEEAKMREIEEQNDREVAENMQRVENEDKQRIQLQLGSDVHLAEQLAHEDELSIQIQERVDRDLAEKLAEEDNERDRVQEETDALIAQQISADEQTVRGTEELLQTLCDIGEHGHEVDINLQEFFAMCDRVDQLGAAGNTLQPEVQREEGAASARQQGSLIGPNNLNVLIDSQTQPGELQDRDVAIDLQRLEMLRMYMRGLVRRRLLDMFVSNVQEQLQLERTMDLHPEDSGTELQQMDQESAQVEVQVEDEYAEMHFRPVDPNWQRSKCAEFHLAEFKPYMEITTPKLKGDPCDIFPIEDDGNCFFRCLSKVITGEQTSHELLRKLVVDHMEEIPDALSVYFPESVDNMDDYIRRTHMRELGKWGSIVEMFAAAHLLHTDIYVFSSCGNSCDWVEYSGANVQSDLGVSRRAIYLNHTLGIHFDVVLDVQPHQDDPEEA